MTPTWVLKSSTSLEIVRNNNNPTAKANFDRKPSRRESRLPSLSEMSTNSNSSSASSAAYDFAPFTENTFENNNNNNNNRYTKSSNNKKSVELVQDSSSEEESSGSSSTFWDLIMSLYLPVLLLWFRRSMFGTANLIRSLILGHVLRFVLENMSQWFTDKACVASTPHWLQSFQWVQPPVVAAGGGAAAAAANAWPPPALTALALLTIFTLVVHPDGFTWIVLGKLRDAMKILLQGVSQCREVLLQDYGVLPTVVASATLAALLFLVVVAIRVLSRPRRSKQKRGGAGAGGAVTCGGSTVSEKKKKKKRKGQARHRGASGGSVSTATGGQASKASSSHPSDASSRASSSTVAPLPTDGTTSKVSGNKTSEQGTAVVGDFLSSVSSSNPSSAAKGENPAECAQKCAMSNDWFEESRIHSSASSPVKSRLNNNHEKMAAPDKQRRNRLPSVSTVDTTAMSDDLSCESASIRSIPSVNLGVIGVNRSSNNKSNNHNFLVDPEVVQQQQQQHHTACNATTPLPTENNTKLRANNNNHRRTTNKRGQGKQQLLKVNGPPKPADGPSRWDALKPVNHELHNAHPHQQQHHQQQQNHLPYHPNANTQHNTKPRRGGPGAVGGNIGPRKGPRNNHHTNNPNHAQFPDVRNAASTPSRKKNRSPNRSHARSPVASSPVPVDNNTNISETHFANTRISAPFPPPPPGLGPYTVGGTAGTSSASAKLSNDFTVFENEKNKNHVLSHGSTLFPTVETTSPSSSLSHRNYTPTLLNHHDMFVSDSFLKPDHNDFWNQQPNSYAGPPARFGAPRTPAMSSSPSYSSNSYSVARAPAPPSPPHYGGSIPFGTTTTVKENPFAPESSYEQVDIDSRIEADLQELGGQMAGSILDF